MLLIDCPYCGLRPEIEFNYGSEAHIARPMEPDQLSDEEWAEFLFMRSNTKGLHRERWMHAAGCRRWFNAVHHTVSHRILATYAVSATPPDLDALES